MQMNLKLSTVLAIAILWSGSRIGAISPDDISPDTSISDILSTATSKFAAGDAQTAIMYLDIAIARDPGNYLSYFKRGAVYLSLGRYTQALHNFDKVIEAKPDFEEALIQRAKLKAQSGDVDGARKDYITARKPEEAKRMDSVKENAQKMRVAVKKNDWNGCVKYASEAILVTVHDTELRKQRANCYMELGHLENAVSDFQYILQIEREATEPHIMLAALKFFSLGKIDEGMAQIKRCLQLDPDSKDCMGMRRKLKLVEKSHTKLQKHLSKDQHFSAIGILFGDSKETGLLNVTANLFNEMKTERTVPTNAPNKLLGQLKEYACSCSVMSGSWQRASVHCPEILKVNQDFVPAMLWRAQNFIDEEKYDAAIRILQDVLSRDHQSKIGRTLMEEAQKLRRKSKQKDYYKVLGVSKDSDISQIKRAYRKLSLMYHPDKAARRNISSEEAERKMREINEAHSVLSDPSLKAKFDSGIDPLNQDEARQYGSSFHQYQFFHDQMNQNGFPFDGAQFPFQFTGSF